MEYQKIILLDNTPNQPYKFRTKNQVECITLQSKFKTSILKTSLPDYSDAYILVIGTITVAELEADGKNDNKKVTFKNCAPFTDCISGINNTSR